MMEIEFNPITEHIKRLVKIINNQDDEFITAQMMSAGISIDDIKDYKLVRSNTDPTMHTDSTGDVSYRVNGEVYLVKKTAMDKLREKEDCLEILDALPQFPPKCSESELVIGKNDPKNGEPDYWWVSYGDIHLSDYYSLAVLLEDFARAIKEQNED